MTIREAVTISDPIGKPDGLSNLLMTIRETVTISDPIIPDGLSDLLMTIKEAVMTCKIE